MSTQETITDIANVRARAAATAAEPGMIAIQNVSGVLKQVTDLGVVSDLGGGAGLPSGTGLVRVDSGTGSVDANATTLVTALEARWENTQQAFLASKVTGLTYEAIKFGLQGAGVASSLAIPAADGQATGGGITGAGPGYRVLGNVIYKQLLAVKWAFAFDAKLPIVSTHDCEIGFYGTVASHYVALRALASGDATHIQLLTANGTPNPKTTTFVADGLYHTFAVTYDLTTITVYVDGTQVLASTDLTQLGNFAALPCIYTDTAGDAVIRQLICGYVPET